LTRSDSGLKLYSFPGEPRWRQEFGGLKVDQAKRLKELEQENLRLKRIVANQAIDIDILKIAASGNF